MASRTSASTGMMIGLAISTVLWLSLFVTSIILFARVQKLNTELTLKQNDLDSAVRSDERNDRWTELQQMAGGRMGVVRYLDNSLQDIGQLVGGNRRETPEGLTDKIKAMTGEGGPALLAMARTLKDTIASLEGQLAEAQSARDAAQADLLASVDRMKAQQEEHKTTVDRLNAEIGVYKSNSEQYRENVGESQANMEGRVREIRLEADQAIASLESEIANLESQLAVVNDQLRRLKRDQSDQSLKPSYEGALVDGRVVGINAAAREVFLDLGKRDRLVVGLPFEVYAANTVVKAGPDGEYPPGKATLEVIRIDDTSSVARIIRENAGTPIIRGDAVANAVYDPRKVYSFALYGNFDTDDDGIATPQGRQDIRAMITQWGGSVSDEIVGDTDFLVLGSKPALPPQPKPTDPVELIQRYLMLKQESQKYDELFETAQRSGIPVLNQNRLYTLTGAHAQR